MKAKDFPLAVLMALTVCTVTSGCHPSALGQRTSAGGPPASPSREVRPNSSAQVNAPPEGVVSPALVGTWVSPDAFIVEFGKGKTTWRLNKNGTYKITVQGRPYSEVGYWGVEGNQFVRHTKGNRGGYINMLYPYELRSHGRTFIYGDHPNTFHKQR